jgi:lipoprotein NlpD
VLLLAGCTASWQAPLETRSPSRPPAVPLPNDAEHYRVQRGDTLHGIAWRAGVDWRNLALWNGLRRPYTIYPGQVLKIKPPPARPVAARPPARPAAREPVAAAPRPAPARTPAAQPRVEPKPEPAPAPKAATRPPLPGGPLSWRWPTDGKVVASFASADPARKGIKIAGVAGQAVRAAEAGDVVYSGSGLIGYGRLIIVKHNENYLSAYGHNRKILVQEGDRVTKGEQIAEMGESNNGQPVLHFEIRRDGRPVDPTRLLPRR